MRESKPEWYDRASKQPFKRNMFTDELAYKIKQKAAEPVRSRSFTRRPLVWFGTAALFFLLLIGTSQSWMPLAERALNATNAHTADPGTTAGPDSTPSPTGHPFAAMAAEKAIEYVRANIYAGQSQAEVEKLLGSGYRELSYRVTEAGETTDIYAWRYDIGVEPGFIVQTNTGHEGWADSAAIQSGKVKAQLFISWAGDQSTTAELAYAHPDLGVEFEELKRVSDTEATPTPDETPPGESSPELHPSILRMHTGSNGWGAYFDGRLAATADGGLHWQDVSPPVKKAQTGTGFVFTSVDQKTAWYFSPQDMTVYATTDGGRNWRRGNSIKPRIVHDGGTALHFVDRSHGWLELMSGGNGLTAELFRTEDGGLTWASASITDAKNPKGLPFGAELSFADPMHGWTARMTGEGKEYPDHLWLFETKDGGKNWGPVRMPIPAPYKDVWKIPQVPQFFSPKAGILALTYQLPGSKPANKTVLFRTDDGGKTWSQSGELEARYKEQPESAGFIVSRFRDVLHGWAWSPGVQVLYKTSDGGRTWAETTTNAPLSGFVQFVSEDVGYLNQSVLTDNGEAKYTLYKTEDGGKTWAAMNPGMIIVD